MSPPSDGARPVAYLVGTPMNDKVLGLSIPNDGSHIKLKVNERMDLYTAADYDALRAEVERLRFTNNLIEKDNAGNRSRAEAAEAKVARVEALIGAWDDLSKSLGFSGDKSAFDIRAALNEGDGE